VSTVADLVEDHLRFGIQKESIIDSHRRELHFYYWPIYQCSILSCQFTIPFHKSDYEIEPHSPSTFTNA